MAYKRFFLSGQGVRHPQNYHFLMALNSPPLERLDHTHQQLPRHNFLHTPQKRFPSGHALPACKLGRCETQLPVGFEPLEYPSFHASEGPRRNQLFTQPLMP